MPPKVSWLPSCMFPFLLLFSIQFSRASICTMLASAFYSEFSRAQTAIGLMFKMIRRESATGDIDEGDKPVSSHVFVFP